MKRYHVCKTVFAENMGDIISMEVGGEITNIELKDEVKTPGEVGFGNCYDNNRYKVV